MAIRIGFSAIKNVGDTAIDNIIEERNTHGPYRSFTDFCLRVNGQKVNKRVLESLIKVGALIILANATPFLPPSMTSVPAVKIPTVKNLPVNLVYLMPVPTKTPLLSPSINFPKLNRCRKREVGSRKLLLGIYVTENPISKC